MSARRVTVADGLGSLAAELRRRADADGADEIALRFSDGGGAAATSAWSWADAWEQARRVAAALREDGIRAGDRLLVVAPDVRAAVAAHFGAWALGAVPIHQGLPYRLADPMAFIGELRATAWRLGCVGLLASRAVVPFARAAPGERVWSIDALLAEEVPGDVAPDAVAAPPLLQLTSGSTGAPRAVAIPHDRLCLHLELIAERLPAGDDAAGVTWLPLFHDMGLIGGLLYPFYTRFPVHVLSPAAFQSSPFGWLEALDAARATHTAAPPSAYAAVARLARRAADAGLRLDRLRCAMIGAEPISPRLLRGFADAFAPCGFRAEAFFPVYGLAEATVAVTFPRPLAPARVERLDRARLAADGVAVAAPGEDADALEVTGVGTPLRDTEVRVVDARGAEVDERVVGELLVRSPTLMAGYDGEPTATAAVLAGGWLRTGDLGFVAGGEVFITGRKKDVIIRAGHNVYPEPLEALAGEVPGARPGCVAVVGVRDARHETERVVVVVETKLDAAAWPDLAARVREALRARGTVVDEVRPVRAGTLPKTTSGKLRRREVAASLAAG